MFSVYPHGDYLCSVGRRKSLKDEANAREDERDRNKREVGRLVSSFPEKKNDAILFGVYEYPSFYRVLKLMYPLDIC